MNTWDVAPLFDKLAFLDADVDVLCRRLATPNRKTPYHFECTDHHRELLIRDLPLHRERTQNLGAVIINAERIKAQVADDLILAIEG